MPAVRQFAALPVLRRSQWREDKAIGGRTKQHRLVHQPLHHSRRRVRHSSDSPQLHSSSMKGGLPGTLLSRQRSIRSR